MSVVVLIALIMFGVVVIVAWLIAWSLPCDRYWKDAHGYPIGPCTRGALHFGPHYRRD